jgi:hypothetical protein
MALTNLPTASLKIDYRDASGSAGSTTFHIPYDTLASVAITAADAVSAALNALSDAAIDGYSITYAKTEDTPATPTAGSRVEEKGNFIWRTANGRTTRFSVPAVVDSILNPSGSIDKANALVTALVAVVTDVDLIFASADGSDITALLEAYQSFRGSTRKQLPSDR